MKGTLLLLAALALPGLARAHDLWIEPAPAGFAVRHGHRGGELLPVEAARVKSARCLVGKGPARDVRAEATGAATELRISGPCDAVSVFRDGGFWSLTPDGEVNLPKGEAAQAVRSWASRQYAKWVDARSAGAGVVLGDELELVPASDLSKARAGEKITLRVLSAGRPVPDARVAVGHRAIGETDSKGEVRLRLRAAGVTSIAASLRRPRPTAEADAEVLEASLTFEVPR